MLGTGLQFRSHGDDRFYDAAKARRSHHQNRNRQRSPAPVSKRKPVDIREPENRAGSEEPSKPAAAPSYSPAPAATASSNLDRFMKSTVPTVRAQYLSNTSMRIRRMSSAENMPHFTMGDLWESFKEWSAYGAGVPLVLNGGDSVIQYYVPYLSAIQLYGEPSRHDSSPRRPGEESDADYSRDSSSEGSSDCELENGLKYSWDQRGTHTSLQEGFSSDEGETGNSGGCLLFEYFERSPPYSREPLADKVLDLARGFLKLKTLRSCDLSPTSWISVAWYPIYRIPTGPTLKDLDACFLTFHSLSTPLTGAGDAIGSTVSFPDGIDGVPTVSLPAFGLASYKFKESIWIPTSGCEKQLANSLLQDAGNWLRMLNVAHPDYQFFASHGVYRR